MTIDDIEVTIDKVTAWEGSSDGSVIQNYDERNRMKSVDHQAGPGKSRQAALVYPAASIEGSEAVLRMMEKRPDPKHPRGRMKTFTNELYVLDLGPPT